MDLFSIIFISLAGLFGGFVGAQVGAGAIVTLPALLFLGLSPAYAIGTNILSGWLINVVAVFKYWRNNKIQFKVVIPLSLVSLAGSFIGANLVLTIDKAVLSKVVAVFFFGLIFLLFKKPKAGLQVENEVLSKKTLYVAFILSFILGIYGGFFSVGVTTFFIFMFTLLLGRSLMQAIADSVFITAVLLIAALFVFAKEANINYSLGIPLAITSMIGSYFGAHTALKLGDRWLKGLLTVLVISLITKLLFGL